MKYLIISAIGIAVLIGFFLLHGSLGTQRSLLNSNSRVDHESNGPLNPPLQEAGDDLHPNGNNSVADRVKEMQVARMASSRLDEKQLKEIEEEARVAEEHRQRVEEQRKLKNEEAEWWESRREWVENFPYEAAYHPEIKFNSELLKEPDIPKPDWMEYLNRPGNITQNLSEYNEARRSYSKKYNTELRKKRVVGNHSMLKGFYENNDRYSEAFQLFYNIMNEYGYAENTVMMAFAFNPLLDYNKAALHDPDEISPDGRTWRENMQGASKGLVANMIYEGVNLYGDPRPSREQAKLIRDRLLSEIPPEKFTELGAGFPSIGEYRDELEEGDPLLYR